MRKRVFSFPQECPSGAVNEETFKSIYSQFFPQGGLSIFFLQPYVFNLYLTFILPTLFWYENSKNPNRSCSLNYFCSVFICFLFLFNMF